MPRQPIPAPGLLVLALALALGLAAFGAATADEAPAAAAAPGHDHGQGAPAAPGGAPHVSAADNPIEPQPSLAIWTVVVFLVLLFVLGKFAWKPLLEALHHREEHLEHVLHETEKARNESERLLASYSKRLTDAEDEVRSLIDEGRKNALAVADEIMKKAQGESEASKERAERDIATAKNQALAEIRSQTANLAVAVAGRVLGRTLSDDDHRRLVESVVTELPTHAHAFGQGASG